MKKVLLPLITLFIVCSAAAQEKENIFLSAELSSAIGLPPSYKSYGLSLAYNRLLGNSKFGLGGSVEFIDIRSRKLGGIMPGIDLRYYSKFGRSTIMPIAQLGYNFYNLRLSGITGKYEVKSGLGYTLGIGYTYGLTRRGSGPFTAIKFRGLQYTVTETSMPARNYTTEKVNLSIGWRF